MFLNVLTFSLNSCFIVFRLECDMRAHPNAPPPLHSPRAPHARGHQNAWKGRMALATRDAAAALRLRGTASTRFRFFFFSFFFSETRRGETIFILLLLLLLSHSLPNPRGGLRGRSRGRSARSGSGGKQVDAGVEGPWWEGRGGISILPPAGLADAAFTAPWERQGAFTVTLRITK